MVHYSTYLAGCHKIVYVVDPKLCDLGRLSLLHYFSEFTCNMLSELLGLLRNCWDLSHHWMVTSMYLSGYYVWLRSCVFQVSTLSMSYYHDIDAAFWSD